jgi:hypothetical protein
VLFVSAHLTDRDRELTRLVGRHRVLTIGQLPAALVRLGMLRRFRPRAVAASAPWHYVLDPIGAAMLGTEDRDEEKWASGQWP